MKTQIGNTVDKKWRLKGYNIFTEGFYDLSEKYGSEDEAKTEAQKYLKCLDQSQFSGSSGGQGGIQEQIFIVGLDGEKVRVWPRPETSESAGQDSE